jgi:hypothetical protein
MTTTRFCTILLLLCVFAALQCSNLGTGNGSETTNGFVRGSIVNKDGSPASHTQVSLIPETYDPVKGPRIPDSCIATTDSVGTFHFNVPDTGRYTIAARHQLTGTRLFITGIDVHKDTFSLQTPATLEIPGAIRVALPDSCDVINGYLYVPGTDFAALLNGNNGFVTMDSVPAGIMPSITYSATNASSLRVIRYGVRVLSGGTVVVAMTAWKYLRQLSLNTTPAGAGVSGDLYGFPVLFRLTSSNFNFAEAKPNGDDIRFTKSDTIPLSYEIEQWDAAQERAAIWVKIDTVYGNSASQNIGMYWGNPAAAAASSGMDVFDTANGFQGVWHLNETGSSAIDATKNHYDGTRFNMTAASAVPGVIGSAQRFNGTSSYIEMTGTATSKLDFPQNGTYMVGAWVYADTIDGIHDEIASKGWYQYFLEVGSHNTWEFNVLKSGIGWENSASPAIARSWTYVVGIRSDTAQYLYVNGICVDSIMKIGNGTTSLRFTGDNFKIGTHSGPVDPYPWFFKGDIDEVRVLNRAYNADWVKLCYMNQKGQDALIVNK